MHHSEIIGQTKLNFSYIIDKEKSFNCKKINDFKENLLFSNIKKRSFTMGKKDRNRVNQPKKNNHIPLKDIISEQNAHGKEYSGKKRKPIL